MADADATASDSDDGSDFESEPRPSRYVVGIDLGTTNSALCAIDTEAKTPRVDVFSVPQLTAPGEIEALETLPSFRYEAAESEFAADSLRLPWSEPSPKFVVGTFARDHGVRVPGRLVASAKSWLCHPGVDRTAALLPWQAPPEVTTISPVEASASYLEHFRHAWDAAHPEEPLAEQDVVVTLPASFDEIARELTIRAARQAGLPKVVLLEEPQAAFYSWIDKHSDDWAEIIAPGQTILVCDVGGGTSDFTLIRVRQTSGGDVEFHRVAVGEHLILGGDNLDLALAKALEAKLGRQLQPRQWEVLVRSCRKVKETLLGDSPPESYTVSLPGSGSGLVGGSVQVSITKEEAEAILLDGFLPRVGLEEKPVRQASGFQEFGLPFAPDAAITRYLAAFLTNHREVIARDNPDMPHDPARPDVILYNGGLFASPMLRRRMTDVVTSWFNDSEPDWQPLVLDNERLDLAVARGAAYYGRVRRGEGVRVAAGLSRTYYIGVAADEESESVRALCLLPAGIEPGAEVALTDTTFELLTSTPAQFPLYFSSLRLTDHPGDLLPVDAEQMTPLPPIRTVLKSRGSDDSDRVPVHLHARLTEIGTLDLWCAEADGKRRWKLQFDVRSATQTDKSAHESDAETVGILDDEAYSAGESLIDATFGPDADADPKKLAKALGRVWSLSRKEWPPSLLRSVWESLIDVSDGRKRSAEHEARWLNLCGFALRPGFGYALDDYRVAETWRTLGRKLKFGGPQNQAEWWILWRRLAGGLTAGQQLSLAERHLTPIKNTHRALVRGKRGELDFGSHVGAEIWRAVASFGLLPLQTKIELGQIAVDLATLKQPLSHPDPLLWAVGRLGARQPLYGPLNTVVPASEAKEWAKTLCQRKPDLPSLPFVLMQLARKTGDRYRDLPDGDRDRVVNVLKNLDAAEHLIDLVREGGDLAGGERSQMFGESLPPGLRM